MSTALRVKVLDIIPSITVGAVRRLMIKMDRAVNLRAEIEITEELRHLTLQVISETFLSLNAEESDDTFATMYLLIVEESNRRVWRPERGYNVVSFAFWRYERDVRRLNGYVSGLIRDRWDLRRSEKREEGEEEGEGGGRRRRGAEAARGDGDVGRAAAVENKGEKEKQRREDILDLVLTHYERENPDANGGPMPPGAVRQIRDEFKTFMLAGHETSAAMMSWTLYELLQNREIWDDVGEEAEGVFGRDAEDDWGAAAGGGDGGGTAPDIPPEEELSRLVLAEGCLRVSSRSLEIVRASAGGARGPRFASRSFGFVRRGEFEGRGILYRRRGRRDKKNRPPSLPSFFSRRCWNLIT